MTKTILEEYAQAYSEQLMCNFELISQIMQLQKKLEIATRALKKYESATGWGREAFLALKEMEGVK